MRKIKKYLKEKKNWKRIMDWRYNTIWFDQIETDKRYFQDFNEDHTPLPNLNAYEYVTLCHLKKKQDSFDAINANDKLLYLNLTYANLESLIGIGKYSNLKRLELHYCTKLIDDKGIQNLRNTLEFLHINQSKKYIPTEELYNLKNLKVLRLNSCKELPNLKFLANLPDLIDFRFVDTKIMDGDLSPIIEHPKIKSVGFMDKRNYNFKQNEIDAILSSKQTSEIKEFAYKGEYVTFRYREIGTS